MSDGEASAHAYQVQRSGITVVPKGGALSGSGVPPEPMAAWRECRPSSYTRSRMA